MPVQTMHTMQTSESTSSLLSMRKNKMIKIIKQKRNSLDKNDMVLKDLRTNFETAARSKPS